MKIYFKKISAPILMSWAKSTTTSIIVCCVHHMLKLVTHIIHYVQTGATKHQHRQNKKMLDFFALISFLLFKSHDQQSNTKQNKTHTSKVGGTQFGICIKNMEHYRTLSVWCLLRYVSNIQFMKFQFYNNLYINDNIILRRSSLYLLISV